MLLDPILARFAKGSPVTVMARTTLERALDAGWVDALFEAFRERQYTRELLFSTTVEVMSLVALGLQPSVHAAARAREDLEVSLTALYDKINGTETGLSRSLVAGSAERLAATAKAVREKQTPVMRGYEVRVIDGNHLPASEKRLAALRGFRGAALPGHSLVVYDPDARLVTDIVPCEDAHAQERTLVPAILGSIKPGQVWIADRNFSTTGIMSGIAQRGGAFIIREHRSSPNPKELGTAKRRGAVESGEIFEQIVEVEQAHGEPLVLRRIELRLHVPTEDGETIIRILTNLPKSVSSEDVAQGYRNRWRIENMFQWLESVLHSEVRTLGRPRAALFAFAVAAVAYNALSVVQGAIESAHGVDPDGDSAISLYFVVIEIKNMFGGMMITLPPESWQPIEQMRPDQVAKFLVDTAGHIKPGRFRKTTRGPKKITKKGYVPGKVARAHVATSRVIAAAKRASGSP
jgi:IS4 transposase